MEVVTDASVVGNGVLTGAAVGPTASGMGEGMGAAATTDSSVVGKSGGALAVGSGVGAPFSFAGTVVGPAFIFARVSCCSFTCCCSVFTVSVKRLNLLAQGFDVVRRRRRRRLLGKNGRLRANQRGGNKRFLQDKFFSALSGA